MVEKISQTYEFLSRGGPVMVVIVVASLICVALIIERALALSKKRIIPEFFLQQLLTLKDHEKLDEVLAFLRASDCALSRILSAGIHALKISPKKADEEIEFAARLELTKMEKNLDHLATLATLGPLLGLFGTVTGMINTFLVIRQVGVGNPLELSAGIAEALITTAAGLCVGIPALIFQRWYIHRINEYILNIEHLVKNTMDHFKKHDL